MEIPLRRRDGSVRAYAIVDPEDFERFGHLRWCIQRDRYPARMENRKIVYMHRAILGLEHGDSRQADHINGNKLDNRRENLRIVTNAQNKQNMALAKNNSSGYRGVYWCKHHQKWIANLWSNDKHITVGYYETPELANEACVKARRELMPYSRT